jgi:hypothetical protein
VKDDFNLTMNVFFTDDDVSSISGSESDSSTEEEKSKGGSYRDLELTKIVRHPKIFFVNKENQVISIYRCLLHGKEVYCLK